MLASGADSLKGRLWGERLSGSVRGEGDPRSRSRGLKGRAPVDQVGSGPPQMLFQNIDGHVSGRRFRLFREALPFPPDPADHRDRAPRSQAGGVDPVGEDQEEGESPRIGFFWPEARVQGGGGQEDVGPGRPVVDPECPAPDHDEGPRETPEPGFDGRVGKGAVDSSEIGFMKDGRIEKRASAQKGKEQDRATLAERSGSCFKKAHRQDPFGRGALGVSQVVGRVVKWRVRREKSRQRLLNANRSIIAQLTTCSLKCNLSGRAWLVTAVF